MQIIVIKHFKEHFKLVKFTFSLSIFTFIIVLHCLEMWELIWFCIMISKEGIKMGKYQIKISKNLWHLLGEVFLCGKKYL